MARTMAYNTAYHSGNLPHKQRPWEQNNLAFCVNQCHMGQPHHIGQPTVNHAPEMPVTSRRTLKHRQPILKAAQRRAGQAAGIASQHSNPGPAFKLPPASAIPAKPELGPPALRAARAGPCPALQVPLARPLLPGALPLVAGPLVPLIPSVPLPLRVPLTLPEGRQAGRQGRGQGGTQGTPISCALHILTLNQWEIPEASVTLISDPVMRSCLQLPACWPRP
jgi:hypothetical protein